MQFANLVRVEGQGSLLMPRMADISRRGLVATGERQIFAGSVVEGTEPQRVMIRGIGPTLEEYGFENALVRPFLKVYADPEAPPLAPGGFWWEVSGGRVTVTGFILRPAFSICFSDSGPSI